MSTEGMSATAVEIAGVTKRFDETLALDAITLRIEEGSFVVLLGPSGSGKTTLLNILGGFLEPTDGRVLIKGADVTYVPPAKRPTTTVFQDYALFPHMTIAGNVGFGLAMQGIAKPERHLRVETALQMVGLAHTSARKVHQLSGGQKQRIALARALVVEPAVLLLDEPLGALDLKLRRQMQEELKAIQKRVGTTFVHVTHDQDEAMAIADTIVVMNEGRIEDQGPPERVYLRPKTRFAADFMGDSNFIDGRIIVLGATVDEDGGRSTIHRVRCIQEQLGGDTRLEVIKDTPGQNPARIVVDHGVKVGTTTVDHPDQRRIDMPDFIGLCRTNTHLRLGWMDALP